MPDISTPNNYDFMLNPQLPAKKPLLHRQDSLTKRALMIVGGGVLLIVLIIVLSSVFFSSGSSLTDLTSAVVAQSELVKIAGSATTQAGQQSTKNLAVNLSLSLTTSRQQLTDYLTKQGHKLSSSVLAGSNSNLDQQLKTALAASNFDKVFTQITEDELTTYLSDLKQAYNATSSKSAKQLIASQYAVGHTLQGQAVSNLSTL